MAIHIHIHTADRKKKGKDRKSCDAFESLSDDQLVQEYKNINQDIQRGRIKEPAAKKRKMDYVQEILQELKKRKVAGY